MDLHGPDVAFIVLMAGPGLIGEEILYMQGALINKAEGKRIALLHTLNNLNSDEVYKMVAVKELIKNLPKPPLFNDTRIPQ